MEQEQIEPIEQIEPMKHASRFFLSGAWRGRGGRGIGQRPHES